MACTGSSLEGMPADGGRPSFYVTWDSRRPSRALLSLGRWALAPGSVRQHPNNSMVCFLVDGAAAPRERDWWIRWLRSFCRKGSISLQGAGPAISPRCAAVCLCLEATTDPPERSPTAQSKALLARVACAIGPSAPRCLPKPRPTHRRMRNPLGKLVVQPFAEIGRLAAWGEPQGHHLGGCTHAWHY